MQSNNKISSIEKGVERQAKRDIGIQSNANIKKAFVEKNKLRQVRSFRVSKEEAITHAELLARSRVLIANDDLHLRMSTLYKAGLVFLSSLNDEQLRYACINAERVDLGRKKVTADLFADQNAAMRKAHEEKMAREIAKTSNIKL